MADGSPTAKPPVAMDIVAVAKDAVHIYKYQPGEGVGDPAHTFPGSQSAETCVWSMDGSLLALVDPGTGGVAVYSASEEYRKLCQIPPLIGGPVRSMYFSPAGSHLVTHERWVKDAGNNVGVWDAKTGESRFSFTMKQQTGMSWPPLKWTSLETHCCRMVQDGVVITGGDCKKDAESGKIDAPGIMAFEVAPRGAGTGPPHVAICIAESKGAPARCQIFNLENPSRPTATKNFFKAQTVQMYWNNTGSALLVKSSTEIDDSGKSYYGGNHLYFMRADGEESCIVANPEEGIIHDFCWSPTQDEFTLLHGDLPCKMALHTGRKGAKLMDFGQGHRNTVRWNPYGRFLALGGYGQLLGDTDFWDKPGKKLLGTTRLECCVVCGWAPDGRHFLGATTAPRMRVDNKIVIYDYCGQLLQTIKFDELRNAQWRPRPRGAFQDRPPSPGREAAAKAAARTPAAAAAKPKAYRPPGARGAGGGLAAMLRSELGSTSAQSSTSATKVFGGSLPPGAGPPGSGPPGSTPPGAGSGAAAGRNARRKKAREAAAAGEAAAAAEESPKAGGFEPPARPAAKAAAPKAAAPAPAPAAAAEGGEASEVEKKVRALRKKLREIEKLKERRADGPIDPLQQQKIDAEGEIISQIRALGAEP